MTPDLSDPTVAREWTLEERMLDGGLSAYRSRVEKARTRGEASTAGAAKKLVENLVERVAGAIEDLVARAASGAPGRRHIAVKLLQGMDPEVVAFLTVSTALNLAAAHKSRSSVQSVAMSIAGRVEDEARLATFAKVNAGLVKAVMDDLNSKTSNRTHKRTVLVHLLNKKGDAWTGWTKTDRLHLGIRLLDLLIQTTGIVEKVTTGAGTKKHRLILGLTEDAASWLSKVDADAAQLVPRYGPMVVPPRPVDAPDGGGYITGLLRSTNLVKPRTGSRRTVKVTPEKSPAVFAAVNAIQATPWKVNTRLLEVLEEAVRRDTGIAGLPLDKGEPIPAKPSPEVMATDEVVRTRWRREAALVHLGNSKLRTKRIALAQTLRVANEHKDDPAIYFPHYLDFRGRVYATPMFLNPQGADFSKALLEFAEAKPILDGTAAGWLAIHGANLFGHDKVSLEERIGWAEERNDAIKAAAADPLGNLWWTEADKPWCFLAWCFEWAGFLDEGLGYKSRVAVALDGSCNGLQHYSAMLRDPVGGKAVNLTPAAEPSDIYGEVAKVVVDKLRPQHGPSCEPMTGMCFCRDDGVAGRWLAFGIDRKITKRPVMVLPYGGTYHASREYVIQAYLKKVAEGAPDPFTAEDRQEACDFLAKLVWEAIGDVVVAARAAMDWLRLAAKVATAAGLPIRWVTPTGFPAFQDYRNLEWRRVKTRLNGNITFLSMSQEDDKLDARRQANGLPPNFVHSLDAAALCLTVDLALVNGVEHFAMIHDSYGTHAANTQVLSVCLRQAFVDMYEEHDPLVEFERALREKLPPEFAERLPPLPERGTLDLQGVLGSDFFFA